MADEYLGPVDDTSPGQHGSNFNAPYRGVVDNRVAPGTLDSIRQAIIAAHLRRIRQQSDDSRLNIAPVSDSLERRAADEMIEAGAAGRMGNIASEGLRRGLIDTSQFGLDASTMGASLVARMGLSMLPHNSATDPILHALSPEETASNSVGFTNPNINPEDAAGRTTMEVSRFLGGSLVPEATMARTGAAVARRIATGVLDEGSLSRFERMALDYVRQPGRVAAANLTGAAGSVAGGHAAAAISPALEPVGQIVGGLLGGGIPFVGRGHLPDEYLGNIADAPVRTIEEPVASVASVAPDTPDVAGVVKSTPEIRVTGEHIAEPVNEPVSQDGLPVPANDGIPADDPVAPARDQAIREHAATHDLTPAETAEMYWTNENPELTASIRDRTNELHQESVVNYNAAGEHLGPEEDSAGQPVIDPEGVYRESVDPEVDAGGEPTQPPEEPPAPSGSGDNDEPPHPSDSVVKRLTAALNSAGRVNKDQEALRTTERAQRVAKAAAARDAVGGEEGVHAALSELKGEMPKLDFEGVRDQFTPEETKSLFTRIRDNSKLRFFEQLRAGLGLKKLLDGQLPNTSELALLGRVFPKDFISAALRNRSLMSKIRDAATNTLNIPRALMSSVDLSAPFRQGLFLVGRKEFYKAWPTMFQQFAKGFAKNDDAFESFMDDIRAMPNYELLDRAKVFFGGVDHNLSTREEAFMSPYAEKIPVLGRLVKASERAYTAFLNKLRADTANTLIELHRELGIEPGAKELESIGRFVNSATGRGNLGRLNSSAPLLNAAFFSPRLIKSRIDMLNPVFYATLSPVVRREAIKSLLSIGAITTTVLGLAAAGGMRVETDMRSSDFGKIRNGDVRYDILGGFGQYLTLAARLATNQSKSLDGQIQTLGERYGSRTRLDTLANFGVNKLAPIPSLVADYLRGKDPTGQPFNLGRAAVSRLTPLYVQDIASVMQDKGPVGAAESLPGMFGTGIQVIPPSHSIDHLGRHTADLPGTETDPVALEVNRLNNNPASQLIGTPSRSVTTNDPLITRRRLSDDEYTHYQETAGRYIHDDIQQEMWTPEWRRMSDEDKRQTIHDIVRDQRANARDELMTPDEPLAASPTASVNDERIDEPVASTSGPAGREFSAAAVVSSLFPGIHVTQEHRDPNSRLGRANPDSWHNRGRQAVDVRPIRGMTFNDYVDTIRNAGYTIIQQRDEVRNPSRWATGPHWHVVLARV